jgi:thiol-disulfide isomerase/thioredoxin
MQRKEAQRQAARQHSRRHVNRNRNPMLFVGGTLVVIAVIIVAFVVLSHQGGSSNPGPTGTPVDATTLQEVTNVSPQLLSQIGTGGLSNPFKKPQGSPSPLTGPTSKPEVFYWGAEWCPLCAAERWSMVVALSRFGSFHSLNIASSASDDSYPSTSTFTFYQSNYTSQYIDFVPVESQDQQRQTLQTPTASQQQLVNTYDAAPYVPAQDAGGFPFIDFGNRYLVNGVSYDPGVLRTNPQDTTSTPLTQQEIASQLSSNNALSKSVLGAANYLTAAICSMTQNKPASVCSDPSIQQIESSLSQTAQAGIVQGGLTAFALTGTPLIADLPKSAS